MYIECRTNEMRIIPVTFMAILVLTMTTSSALMFHPQDPLPQAFAQSSEDPIRDLGTYVVFGFDEVELDKDVTVISGSVGTQNEKSEVEIDENTTFQDPNSAVVGDNVEINKNAVVQDVYYNKLENKGRILGTENTPLSLPVIERFPNLPELMVGDESIKVEKDESLSLPAGQYDEIALKKGATLIFEGGEYSVSSIKADKESNIVFDEESTLIVQGKIKMDKNSFFGPSDGSGLSASEIVVFGVGMEKVSDDDDRNERDEDDDDRDERDDDDDRDDKKQTKIEFKKESTIVANIFAPNGEIEIGEESHATGAFVANEVEVGKGSTLELDSSLQILALIDEYSTIIEDLEEISNISDEEIIDFLESKIGKLREIVSVLESKGFTVDILVQRMSPTTSTILFINPFTLQSFEVEIPNSALAALLTIGIFEEASLAVQFTGEEIAAMLNAFPTVIDHIANLPDEAFSIEFFEFISCVGVAGSASECFPDALVLGQILRELAEHPEIIDFIAEQLAIEGFPKLGELIFPQASVSGFKFNDRDNSGTRDPANEPLLPKWNFTITSKFIGGIDSGIQTKGQTNDAGFYFFNDLDYPVIVETIVIIEDLDQSLIDQGWVHTTPSVIEIPFEPDLVRTDVNFGNRQEAILEVTKVVIKDDGGTLDPSDFTIHVTGNNAEPSDFAGNSVAVEVVMTPGEYSVSEDSVSGFTTSFSEDCTGSIAGGERKSCIITNDDISSSDVIWYGPTSSGTINVISHLQNLGVDVEQRVRPINDLQANLVVIAAPGFFPQFTQAEKDEIINYVFNGGSLMLLPDTDYFRCGNNCNLEISQEFGFRFDGDLDRGTLMNTTGPGQPGHPIFTTPNAFESFPCDPCFDAFVRQILDPANVQVLAKISGQSREINESSQNIRDAPAIVFNANPAFNGGKVLGGGFNMVVGFGDLRMFENVISFMLGSSIGGIPPGGPYFDVSVNQASIDVTRPDSITIPLEVNWQEGYYAESVNITFGNMTDPEITPSVVSISDSTHSKQFEITFDVSSDALVGDNLISIYVTEIENEDTVGKTINLNVNGP